MINREILAEYNLIDEQIKALKKKQDALKEKIKNGLGDDKEVVIDNYKVTNKVIVSTMFDSVKFKRANIDLYNQFTKDNITTRLTIKKI